MNETVDKPSAEFNFATRVGESDRVSVSLAVLVGITTHLSRSV